MEKISLSRKEIERLAKDNADFYNLDINRVSSLLILQIIQLEASRLVSPNNILDEVKYLDGLTSSTLTKKENCFKKLPLKGLFKKHFFCAGFLAQNLMSNFGIEYGGNKKLKNLINCAFDEDKFGFLDKKSLNKLGYDMIEGAYEERAKSKRLTGEWILYQEFQGKNYYLTLAFHTEKDEDVYRRVCDIYNFDFPFLKRESLGEGFNSVKQDN
ncbi:MAG: hypothetical protein DWQ06_04630 [Calditrichaeota bacterium]|nr:MAG: hypothetical protein DWQ06_04630 [Calditrichota bacterium]